MGYHFPKFDISQAKKKRILNSVTTQFEQIMHFWDQINAFGIIFFKMHKEYTSALQLM